MKTAFKPFLAIPVFLLALQCGGDSIDGDAVGHLDDITISAIDADDQIDIIIPDSYFGDNPAAATFDVALNDVSVGEDLDPTDTSLHDDTAEVVAFSLDSVAEGDEVTLTITDSDGDVGVYTATVSDEITYAVESN